MKNHVENFIKFGTATTFIGLFIGANYNGKNDNLISFEKKVSLPLLYNKNSPVNHDKNLKYTPYQMLAWEIKANEGYHSWWYRDGYGQNGNYAYSIGFGWNDLGGKRRNEIKEYTKDNRVTYDEALEITLKEIEKYGKLHNDPLKNLALRLYSYNCGPIKNHLQLGKCCGSGKGCGNANDNIRKMHNRRRKYELALWNKDYTVINQITEDNRKKANLLNNKYQTKK